MSIAPAPRRADLVARVAALHDDVARFLASCRKRRDDDVDALGDDVQAVMTEAIASLPTYSEELGDLKSWVLGIAANVARRAERTRLRDARNVPDDAVAAVAQTLVDSPEHVARMRELQRKVAQALRTMPEKLFMVLYLVGIDGKSHQEAAEILGITEDTSRKRLQDARRYIEKKAGINRDELHAIFPFAAASEGEQPEGASSLAKLLVYFFPGVSVLALGCIVALLWPSPSVDTARVGLSAFPVRIATTGAPSIVDGAHANHVETADEPSSHADAETIAAPKAPPRARYRKADAHPDRILTAHRMRAPR